MGKTIKGKVKTAAKKTAMQKKIARKCKGKCAALAAIVALAAIADGCSTTGPQPSRAINQWNRFENCTFTANAGKGTEPVELFTQTQANEGSETVSPTATPTLDVKTDITAKYNDAIASATTASRGVLETLMIGSANKVLGLMADKGTGTVEVTKKDGAKACVSCADGQCEWCEDCGGGSSKGGSENP